MAGACCRERQYAPVYVFRKKNGAQKSGDLLFAMSGGIINGGISRMVGKRAIARYG